MFDNGKAKEVVLGPVDEPLGYESIDGMPILFIPYNKISTEYVKYIGDRRGSKIFFEMYNEDLQIKKITTDKNGKFCIPLLPGSYVICSAYKYPTSYLGFYYSKRSTVEEDDQRELEIILTRGGRLLIEIIGDS